MNTQNTETPLIFVQQVQKYLDIKFKYDMAADSNNFKAPYYFTEKDDSLSMDWPLDGWCWLNPTFKNLTKWIKKCKEQKDRGCCIVSIWPLSCDKNQIETFTKSSVFVIHGRIWPNVRGCMLCVWIHKQPIIWVTGLSWDKKELKEIW